MDVIRRFFVICLLLGAPLWVQAGQTVNINTANATTLAQAMRGVGPAKAELIVQYREQNGPFKSIRELTRVKGIGVRTVELNSELITISEAETTLVTKAPATSTAETK